MRVSGTYRPPKAPKCPERSGRRGRFGGSTHGHPRARARGRGRGAGRPDELPTLAGSFRPGAASTPELTSTPHGRATRTASPTVSGVSPADRITRPRPAASRASVQEIGARASPSLQRAGLSRRNAAGL